MADEKFSVVNVKSKMTTIEGYFADFGARKKPTEHEHGKILRVPQFPDRDLQAVGLQQP